MQAGGGEAVTFARLLIVLVAAQCAGCSGGDILRGSGVETQPPEGYLIYCRANPQTKECGG